MEKHILVIDDQESMRSIISTVLKDKGYKVTAVDDGETALTFFKNNPDSFDLILADINMPKIDGFELLKIIKESHPKTPVVFLTGMNTEVTEIMGEKYNVDGIINKPFIVDDILATVKRIISK